MSSLDYLDLCRLCLVKDRVSVPIFEGEGDVRQIFLKIAACLPVKVAREDKLPKKICDDCVYKVELFYQFWNTTANSEKQLLQWLGEVDLEDKQAYVTNVLNPSVMKQEQSNESRLDGTVMQQVSGHQNNMGMGMMDNMGLGMPMMMSTANQQQMTSVPMDTSGSSVQTVQAVPGPSTQTTHDQMPQNQTNATAQQEEEDESSEEDENSDEECDGDEGLPVKEESEEDPNSSRTIEPTTFVNVSLACDEAGPSGLQQQKMAEMSDIAMSQPTDGDPKSGNFEDETPIGRRDRGRFVFNAESITMRPWNIIKINNCLYYGFLPEEHQVQSKTEMIRDLPILEIEAVCNYQTSDGKDMSKEIEKARTKSQKLPKTIDSSMDTYDKEKSEEEREDLPGYSCTQCSFTCRRPNTLKLHVSRKHRTKIRSFKCVACDLSFELKSTLKSHYLRKHTSVYRFTCDHCNKKYKVKGDLTNHIRLYHQEQEVVCELCGKACSNSNSLYTHQKRIHYKPKYECPLCKQRMVSAENLDQHLAIQHQLGNKQFCTECGKTFTSKTIFQRHVELVHNGAKMHKCQICNKTFNQGSYLKQHLILHAKGKQSFVCEICGKGFPQKLELIEHRKTHSAGQISVLKRDSCKKKNRPETI